MLHIQRAYEAESSSGDVRSFTVEIREVASKTDLTMVDAIIDGRTYHVPGLDLLDALISALRTLELHLQRWLPDSRLRWEGGEGLGISIPLPPERSTELPSFKHAAKVSVGLALLEAGAVDRALGALKGSMSLLPEGSAPDTRLADALRAAGVPADALAEWDTFVEKRSRATSGPR